MHNFHFMNSLALHEKITQLLFIENFKGLNDFFNKIFNKNSALTLKFLNSIDYDKININYDNECVINSNVKMNDEIFETLCLFHNSKKTFSIALIVRSILHFAVDYILDYGLDAFLDYMEEIIYFCKKKDETKRRRILRIYLKLLGLKLHMLQNISIFDRKILFFNVNNHYLTHLQI